VLVDGNDIWKKDGEDRFKGVVAHAQQSPQALTGKVGVVGFSLGGGPAAVHDAEKNCCMIDMARKLAAAAKAGGEPLELTEYPNANHGFNLRAVANYREQDAADAFARTLAHLKKYLAPPA
jgi:dienelactone hydrolase